MSGPYLRSEGNQCLSTERGVFRRLDDGSAPSGKRGASWRGKWRKIKGVWPRKCGSHRQNPPKKPAPDKPEHRVSTVHRISHVMYAA